MMLKSSQISRQPQSVTRWPHPFFSGGATVASSPAVWRKPAFRHRRNKGGRVSQAPGKFTIKAVQVASPRIGQGTSTKVKIIVTTQARKVGITYNDLRDYWVRRPIVLELISAELERSGKMKPPITGSPSELRRLGNEVQYEWDAEIPCGFGEIGAVKVENDLHNEIYVKSVDCDGLFSITCNSWVASKYDNPSDKRIFFTNKLCLPYETPSGLKDLRKDQLKAKQGDGTGMRQFHDRIYDYDVYNDLGNPDGDDDKMARPVLGGAVHPYPRRCRTGRQRSKKDPSSESREEDFYIPRDEKFSEDKEESFYANLTSSAIDAFLPYIKSAEGEGFLSFTDIDSLFNEGVELAPGTRASIISRIINYISRAEENIENMLRFQIPEFVDKDRFSWLRDEEFARQTLAGANPYSIRLVKKEDWPLKSALDHTATSAITDEIVEQEIKEIGWTMTVEEALDQKRLFMLDYHDLLLPYVERVSKISGTTLYGSRTLFFLKPDDGTLKPIAIELTRPPADEMPQWKQVYTPSDDATGCWLWRLAKVHVLAHDAGYHQLVSHWLRTHCVVEPYIIASNRQLSTMHPIYRLLHPHFRYTMDINARARQRLINANGIIERTFSPSKYCMEISSVAYDKLWRFDQEALHADLVSRGMAVEDPNAPHGLKLAIEDYPFANDGLLLWDAIEEWVSDYVNRYYPNAGSVESDIELQAWWTEIRTVGHGDKKDQLWWPKLKTAGDLINILATMIWVTSGHHAAVNFGQYLYGAYFPNRPTIARTRMPHDGSSADELKEFKDIPENTLLRCLPTQGQAIYVIGTLGLLSNHSEDEEYIGTPVEAAWEQDPIIKLAFQRFSEKLRKIEVEINKRNEDPKLKNRYGAGIVPYELLKPSSGPGVTGKGVPYSISI